MILFMKKSHKIVIIRGLVTAGKTTISHELAKVLPAWIFIDVWKIKEMFEPLGLKDRTPLKTISKKGMITLLREVMRTMSINIILQESSRSFINKYLRKDLKKYNYKIYSFFLDVSFENAIKRDKQREKPTMYLDKNYNSETDWKKSRVNPEKGDVIVNTNKSSTKEITNIILKVINEKRKKHPHLEKLRKTW